MEKRSLLETMHKNSYSIEPDYQLEVTIFDSIFNALVDQDKLNILNSIDPYFIPDSYLPPKEGEE